MKSEEPIPTSDMVKRTRAVAAGILLFSAASALTVGGHAPGVQADPAFDFMRLWRKARAAEAYRLAHPELASEGVVPRQEFVGPPIPAKIVVARAAVAQRRGGIGPLFGPEAFAGAMNTTVSLQGVVRGPNYRGAPLPNTGGVVALPGEYFGTEVAPEVEGSDLSSEIPDLRSVALSRLANPDPTAGAISGASKPSKAVVATAPQGQLSLQLHAVRPRRGFRAGDDVAIRLSASAASYAAVIRVDTTGKAAVAFRSPGPSTTFGCVIKTGPTAGSEYYVAVASVKPLNGADVAAALRSVGMTYSSAAPSPEGGLQPTAAWNTAVQFAGGAFSGAPAGAARWQRNEFAVTGASVAVRTPQAVATAKKPAPAPAKTGSTAPTPKPGTPTPAPAESVVPTEAPKPAPTPAESELPKENPQTTPTTPNVNGAKWDLPPTTRRKPGARPNGATLELLPVDVRERFPSVASAAGPTAAIVPET